MENIVLKKDETQDDLESSLLEWLKGQSSDKLVETIGDFILDNWMNLQYSSISDASVKFMFREFGTQGVTDMVKNIKEEDLDVKFDDTILGGDIANKESSKLKKGFHGILTIKSVWDTGKSTVEMVNAINEYKKTGKTDDLLIAVRQSLNTMADYSSYLGPLGLVCSGFLNICADIVEFLNGVNKLIEKRYAIYEDILNDVTIAITPQQVDKAIASLLNSSLIMSPNDRRELEQNMDLMREYNKYFDNLVTHVDITKIEDAKNSYHKYESMQNNLNTVTQHITQIYHDKSTDENGVKYDLVFGADGTITKVQQEVSDASKKPQYYDPLIFDINGDGLKPIGVLQGTHFDIDGNGIKEKMSWITKGDALLVYDRNGNGIIDNGKELFSNYTVLMDGTIANSGLQALAELDENGDGIIDERDPIFNKLRMWLDNGDGITQNGELKTLKELGITSIDVGLSNTSEIINGVEIRNEGSFTKEDGSTGGYGEIWSKPNFSDSEEINKIEVSDEVQKLIDVRSFGTLPSLHQAMMKDTSGQTIDLVKRIMACDDMNEKKELVKELLAKISGAESIAENSRGGYIDARQLAVIEAFMGERYIGQSGANPTNTAAPLLKKSYEKLVVTYMIQIMLENELKDYCGFIHANNDGSLSVDIIRLCTYLKLQLLTSVDLTKQFSALSYMLSSRFKEAYDALLNTFIGTTYGQVILESYIDGKVGTKDNDTLFGTTSDDMLVGMEGNDTLYGNSGNDTLVGGKGDDLMEGSTGNDTYIYLSGDGNDTIDDIFGDNTIRLDDLKPNDITISFEKVKNDMNLIILDKNTQETIRVKNYFYTDSNKHMNILFSDGTVWNKADIEKIIEYTGTTQNDTIYAPTTNGSVRIHGDAGDDSIYGSNGDDLLFGDAGNDTLYGNSGNDTLVGGKGDDLMQGSTGNDTYIYLSGDGNDTIDDIFGDNTIRLDDLKPSDITISFEKVKNDMNLLILDKNTQETIRVKNYFYTDSNKHMNILFSDGTVWNKADIEKIIEYTGTTQNDTIYAPTTNGSVRIHGDAGNDILYGSNGDDLLFGDAGNDSLYGNSGNDTLVGGKGDDLMQGSTGNDTYIYLSGDGNDTIDDIFGDNTIRLDDLKPSDITISFEKVKNDMNLLILDKNTQETIRVKNYFHTDSNKHMNILFSDGTVWNKADIEKIIEYTGTTQNDTIYAPTTNGSVRIHGDAGNDTLNGSSGNDTLVGGKGDDLMQGSTGNDTYIYLSGDGNDTIDDIFGDNTIRLDDLKPSDITISFEKVKNDMNLIILDKNTQETIRVKNYFYTDSNKHMNILFSDGTVWNKADIEKIIEYTGTTQNDTIYAPTTNGSVRIQGDAGNDILYGSNGDDLLFGDAGNDSLYGNSGNDTLVGGKGDDLMQGSTGNDTYIYLSGDGNDTIDDIFGDNTIRLDDLKPNDITISFEKVKNDMNLIILDKNTQETIRVKNYFYTDSNKHMNILFSDGTVWNKADIEKIIEYTGSTQNDTIYAPTTNGSVRIHGDAGDDSIYGSNGDDLLFGDAGNDTLYGNSGNDTLVGGKGDDLMQGSTGNDTYVYLSGDGNDTIDDIFGDNTIRLDDLKPSDISISFEKVKNDMDLLILDKNTQETIRIKNYFYTDSYKRMNIQFSDGTVWNKTDIDNAKNQSVSVILQEQKEQYAYIDPSPKMVSLMKQEFCMLGGDEAVDNNKKLMEKHEEILADIIHG